MTETDDTPRAVVERLYDCLADGRIDDYVAQFADDAVWIEPAGSVFGGEYRGPEAIRDLLTAATEEWWTEFEVDVDRFLADGDTVVAVTTTRGVYARTGEQASARAAHLYVVEDGLVVRMESFEDTGALHTAIDRAPDGLSEIRGSE